MKRSRRLTVLPEQADHVVDQQLGGTANSKRARPRPRYTPEVVRDRDVPVEMEVEIELAELLTTLALSGVPVSPVDALAVLLLWNESHERYVAYRAARVLAGTFTPVAGVPATRADCPVDRHERGCPRIGCRQHLWLDTDPAGRPGLELVPRDQRGLTLSVPGAMSTTKKSPQLLPRWLEHPLPASCALDLAGQGANDNLAVGAALDVHRTLVGRAVVGGLIKLRDAGITLEDLLATMADAEPANTNLSEMIESGIAQRRRSSRT